MDSSDFKFGQRAEVAWSREQWACDWMVASFNHQTSSRFVGREIESATVPFISNSCPDMLP